MLIIVGNKIDLYDSMMVTEIEGEKFAMENEAIFYLVSSANGEGINELFETIGKII